MTILIHTLEALRQWQASLGAKPLALVPTMGNLHDGHLALVKQAQDVAEVVVVSIFVNPTQFGANEDLEQYPRTLEADLEACRLAQVDAVFAPNVAVLYPEGVERDGRFSVVPPTHLTNRLCGKSRPHHFEGVCTVVLKLFNLIQPQVAIFGEKDAQQLAIIKAMVRDLHLPIEIQAHPVVRNESGLALSSRNQYLQSEEAQQTAVALFETLVGIATAVHTLAPQAIPLQKAFELSWQSLQPMYPLGKALEWEYVEAVDAETFAPQETLSTTSRLLVAARLEGVRLIDTLRIDSVLP